MDNQKYESSPFRGKIKALVMELNSLRSNSQTPVDITFREYLEMNKEKYNNATPEVIYDSFGINPAIDTVNNMFTMPDEDVRWLIPEIWRDAIRLGLRKAPIWPNIVSTTQTVNQTTVKMPFWNMSDAVAARVNEGETIPVGNVSYGSKQVSIYKVGRGIKVTDEVRNYVSVNIVSIYLQDFGIKMGHSLDSLLIDILLNGDQANGSESAPVVGIATAGTLIYKDLLKIFIRMARLGRTPNTMIAGEDMALEVLDLDEFKTRRAGTTDAKLNLKTPVPNSVDFFIHGNVPDDQVIMVDTNATVIKLDAQPLMVESERIVSNQTEATYATVTTGFAGLFRDGRIVMDQSLAFASYGFPSYMDPTSQENVPWTQPA